MDSTNREKRERIATQVFINLIGRIPGDVPKAVEISFKATDLFLARLQWPTCAECKGDVDPEDTVWINPSTGEASTGEGAKAYHVRCAPEQHKE